MAALFGRLKGNRGECTRLGSEDSGIFSKLETWHGSVETRLSADGTFSVFIGDKASAYKLVARGNVDARSVSEVYSDAN